MTMKKNSNKDTNNEGKVEFLFSVIFGCLHLPALLIWFVDEPNLLSDLYFSTVFFLLGLAT